MNELIATWSYFRTKLIFISKHRTKSSLHNEIRNHDFVK